ncbi:MAG TPA: phosphodiester glycosidase family protein [Candidatus Aquilonibacter sp.]|nr:phosphodiester glycosidase family protein [Candidatus Aquilonibacter sp.]
MIVAALVFAALPLHIEPQAPFPRVLSAPRTAYEVTPGVEYGRYDLRTSLGPIVVRVLEIAPHAPDLRIDAVLAHDALTSTAETVSSMADRTGAIAGINGDYFDIGATNQPTNIVVRSGALLRTPRKRYALFVGNDGTARIDEVSFTGQVQIADRSYEIDAVNEMLPPHGGISLLTPQYGSVAPNDTITLLAIKPTGNPPFTNYVVGDQADNFSRQPAGYYLAIGPNAIRRIPLPNPGDPISITGDLDPDPLASTRAAVGGGPLILDDGSWYDDLDGPRGGSYDMRAPQSGAAITPNGTLLLFQIDGRQPDLSIGVTPREFSALMRAFGATRGMEFDSGGSSEMAVRVPGDARAVLVNSPSDGRERPVADGVFVYSDAPVTQAQSIVAQPQTIRALAGARVAVRLAAVDASRRPATAPAAYTVTVSPAALGRYANGTFAAQSAGTGALVVRSGALEARVPIEVTADPARIDILPAHPGTGTGGQIALHAHAFDASGYELALPDRLPWRATSGSIDPDGVFSAGNRDALVSLLLGDHLANVHVAVGYRDVPIAFGAHATFMSSPHGGEGSLQTGPCAGCLELRYALARDERAAYAVDQIALPLHSAGIGFDVLDDGSGMRLKVVLHNAIDEEVLLPVATLDRPGWRHVVVHFPASLAQPARLTAIYVIGPAPGTERSGTITIRNVKAVVAGSE